MGSRGRGSESPGPAPETIVWNAKVYTMDPALPRAEAFAVKNGRFLAVGRNDDVRNLASSQTEVDRRRRDDGDPGLHRRSLPSVLGRSLGADPRELRPSQRRGHPGGDRETSGRNPSGRVGRRLQVRRHQAPRGTAAEPARPRCRRPEPSRRRRPPRRSHLRVQQQGFRKGGDHRRHARSRRGASSIAREESSPGSPPSTRTTSSTRSSLGGAPGRSARRASRSSPSS